MEDSTVSVIIATYGDQMYWDVLANRAERSVRKQSRKADQFIRVHRSDFKLHEVRNYAAFMATSDWLCFLDGDDELETGYLEAMMKGSGDLRYPKVRYMNASSPYTPEAITLPFRNLLTGNFMVIGTLVERLRFLKVGGFRDLTAWEDWDLWIRCWLDGAKISLIENAIYRAHVRESSRNLVVKNQAELFQIIAERYRYQAIQKGLA